MPSTFIPDGLIRTPRHKPTEKDRVIAFWQALEEDRHRRHPTLSFRDYMRLPQDHLIADFRHILATHKIANPEKLELEFLKLRELYSTDAPTPD